MIENYRGLAVFVAVADAGSFSAAGRQLKLSTSVVSHHVSKLEEKLGAPLFFRSTRSLTLTSEGKTILNAARRMVSSGEEALDALADHSEQPVGALRVSLPAFGMNSFVDQIIWNFAKAHPLIALSLHTSDKPVDLIREGYDLAIRLGVLSDSALKNRRIGTFHRKLLASPDFLKTRDPIETLEDLVACEFVSVSMLPEEFTISRGEETFTIVPENVRLEVDSITACKAAVVAGLGYMHLPLNEVRTELRAGTLVELLPEWTLPSFGIYAVWPDAGPQKKLTRRLIDFLVEQKDLLAG